MNSWFRGFRGRMFVLVVLPVLIMIGVSASFVSTLNRVKDSLIKSNEVRAPLIEKSGDMNASMNAIVRYLWTGFATIDEPEQKATALKAVSQYIANFDSAYREYKKLPQSSDLIEKFKPVDEFWPIIKAQAEEISKKIESSTTTYDPEIQNLIRGEFRTHNVKLTNALYDVNRARIATMISEAKVEEESIQQAETILIAIQSLAILFCIIYGLWMSHRVSSQIMGFVGSISNTTNSVTSASEELRSSSRMMAQTSTEAASALEETVASMEEISSLVKTNSQNCQQASQLSSDSTTVAQDGEQKIRGLIVAMTEISASSKKIEEIIQVIDDLAFQTNLLALNASVEAARAGEHGKGFAVVADAVRSLAQKSANSAKDISVLIQEIVHKIQNGSDLAQLSGEVLGQILTSTKKVQVLSQEIAASTQQQSQGTEEISRGLNQIDQTTQQNAAVSEEISASAESLSHQAQDLNEVVQQLYKLIEGVSKTRIETISKEQNNHQGTPPPRVEAATSKVQPRAKDSSNSAAA